MRRLFTPRPRSRRPLWAALGAGLLHLGHRVVLIAGPARAVEDADRQVVLVADAHQQLGQTQVSRVGDNDDVFTAMPSELQFRSYVRPRPR
jgi:hypothetical protein